MQAVPSVETRHQSGRLHTGHGSDRVTLVHLDLVDVTGTPPQDRRGGSRPPTTPTARNAARSLASGPRLPEQKRGDKEDRRGGRHDGGRIRTGRDAGPSPCPSACPLVERGDRGPVRLRPSP